MQPIPFGKYLLLERLAQGGMAEVFRGVYQGAAGFEKQVAVKRVLPVFEGARDFQAMFVDEARIASSLTHVNVAQVFDFGEIEGVYYLAMELVDGVDLGRLRERALTRGIRIPVPVVAFIIAEAARGLAYAHDKKGNDGQSLGIVHRDVSPQNILVSYSGEVKIADFGIAKATGKLHKTESGAVMGKIRYMSPEQINGEPLDGRSDLFALGTIFWELLVGSALWNGDNPGAVSDQVKNAKVDAPSRRGRDIAPELDRIVLKALERSRDARYGRAAEVARELSAWLSQAAPSLTREDVGAFVQDVVPRPEDAPPPSVNGPVSGDAATEISPPSPALGRAATAQLVGSERVSSTIPPAQVVTRPERRSARSGSVAPLIAVGGVLLVGGVLAFRYLHLVAVTPAAVVEDGGVTSTVTPRDAAVAGARVSEADKLRMVAELEALPRAASTWRGVQTEDYLAVLSAVDGALCLTPSGAREIVVPGEEHARVQRERLVPETMALGRYLLATGELPPRVAVSLQAFLRSHPAWAPGAGGWAVARLGALVTPEDAALRLALIRQNGALAGWRDPSRDSAAPNAELCERPAAVAAYAKRAPGERATALERFLRATPNELPVDDAGVRYAVVAAERDEAAATLLVRVRVTNPGGDDKPLALDKLRLSGLDAAPLVDPPAPRLGPGLVRDVRLTFAGVTDAVAEAAVLVLGAGVELQAYSEVLR
ncbi:MAG: serine/threonine protein kinase [Myxococcales bacterium]|nr:serine/threonine protein kinase [Myxococcales bacterium]